MHPEALDFQRGMIEALEAIIRETKQEVNQLKKTKDGLDERLQLENHHLAMLKKKLQRLTSESKIQPTIKTVADMIVSVLLEAQSPMKASDIAAKLEENGVPTNAKNGHRSSVLVTLRRRPDLFRRVQRGVYELCNPVARREYIPKSRRVRRVQSRRKSVMR